MLFEENEQGNLVIKAEPEDAEMLQDIRGRYMNDDLGFLEELLELTGWSTNGRLCRVRPEDIGALTDAPIVTNEWSVEDNGEFLVTGKVWWYPNYMVSNFADGLMTLGHTTFQLAPAY